MKKIYIIIIVIIIALISITEIRNKQTYQTEINNINEVTIEQTTDKVKVKVSKDDKLHVTYYKGLSYQYDVTEKDGKLTIIGRYKFPISFDFQSPTLVIELPANYGKKLVINTESSCSVDKSIQFDDIIINSNEE